MKIKYASPAAKRFYTAARNAAHSTGKIPYARWFRYMASLANPKK